MTRRIMTVALAVCASLPLMAQGGPGPMGGPMGGPGGGPGGRVGFLAGYLELTASQQTAAKAIFDAAGTASAVVSGQLTSAHEKLRTAIKDGGSDAVLDTLSAPIGTLQGQLVAIQSKAEAKFYALLTTEQKAKYDARGGGPGMGPRGMGPGGMQNRGMRGQ